MYTAMGGRTNSESESCAEILAISLQHRRLFPRGGFAGLEPAEIQVLLCCHLTSHQTVGALARSLGLARPTVSNALAFLEDNRYVRVMTDLRDARRQHVHLAPRGRHLVSRFLDRASAQSPGQRRR